MRSWQVFKQIKGVSSAVTGNQNHVKTYVPLIPQTILYICFSFIEWFTNSAAFDVEHTHPCRCGGFRTSAGAIPDIVSDLSYHFWPLKFAADLLNVLELMRQCVDEGWSWADLILPACLLFYTLACLLLPKLYLNYSIIYYQLLFFGALFSESDWFYYAFISLLYSGVGYCCCILAATATITNKISHVCA